jgi:DNA (cytosine-5)-methyltransferase 1
MKLKETITYKEICGRFSRNKLIEASDYGHAAFTHYLFKKEYEESRYFKEEAVKHVKRALKYKYPNQDISSIVAENALQYVLFNFNEDIPFPEPKNPKFTFIDLFAGIGGFRIAMQNLGGRCVFTSEWDEQAKLTYETNFGDTPFGDITKEETKKYIPDNFDMLCAGFPCQAFSIMKCY